MADPDLVKSVLINPMKIGQPMAGNGTHRRFWQLEQAGSKRACRQHPDPFHDLRQHQIDIFANHGAMDEVDRLAPVEQVDLGTIRPVEGQHMGAHLFARPRQLGQREGELVVCRGDRGHHGAGAQRLQIRQVQRAVTRGADHQFSTAKGLGALSINFYQYKNADNDKALDTGASSGDFATRKAAYEESTRNINEAALNIWLFNTPYALIAQPNVRGLGPAQQNGFGNFLPKPWFWPGVWKQR